MQENIIHLSQWKQIFSCNWDVQAAVESENEELYLNNTRVYYNSYWISKDHVKRYLNNVCVTHARRDAHMTSLHSVEQLLSKKERLRARKHIVAMRATMYAQGGCGPFPRILNGPEDRKEALILFFPTIDWDLKELEAENFFILHNSHERLKRIRDKSMLLSLGQGYYFDENAYVSCVAEDILLLLMSAEEEQLRQNRAEKVWIKLPPLGFGPGVFSWNGIHIGPLLVRSFFWGVLCALNSFEWSRIGVLEIVDISKQFSLTPNWPSMINGVQIVSGRRRDILDFSPSPSPPSPSPEHIETLPDISLFDAAVVCPGDVFAWPGNELHDSCLNSMIGNNTSMRRMGSPSYNSSLQCDEVYVPVRVPLKLAPYNCWWPPREMREMSGFLMNSSNSTNLDSNVT